jgi:hypothetical protein
VAQLFSLGVAMKRSRTIVVVLGVAVVAVLWLIQDYQYTRSESEMMGLIHSLQGTNITKIVISDEKGSGHYSVSAPAALDTFARAINTAEPYSPNHPQYEKHYFVELYLADGQKREFEFDIMQQSDRTIYVYFVWRYGDLTSYYGNCKSAALFDWMKMQTPNKSPEPSAVGFYTVLQK